MNTRYTTAGIFIKNGRVLVAKRINEGALSGKWEFPGGKNRYSETLSDTLIREFKEELDVQIFCKDEIFTTEFDNKDTHYILKAFLIDIPNPEFTLTVHTDFLYAGEKELKELDFGKSDSKIASFLLENNFLED